VCHEKVFGRRLATRIESRSLLRSKEAGGCFGHCSLQFIWNPDHLRLDKNWQIGTYVSEHGTDLYIHVYVFTYSH
jgi:hypothetical protein